MSESKQVYPEGLFVERKTEERSRSAMSGLRMTRVAHVAAAPPVVSSGNYMLKSVRLRSGGLSTGAVRKRRIYYDKLILKRTFFFQR